MKNKSIFNKGFDLLIIAEIGMTHNGDYGLAVELTQSAIKAGANVIKYQWHIAEEETTKNAPSPPYFKNESRFEYFKRTEFSKVQFRKLVRICKSKNVIPCTSVFSIESVKRAKDVGFEIIKVPSGEVTNIPLLREVNKTNLFTILSSGMSKWSDLDLAVKQFNKKSKICILQCTSLYPTPADKVGLNVISEISRRYNTLTGLSDHTLSSVTSVAAVALGARVIEKHFTTSKKLYGPDAWFSLNPKEFNKMVKDLQFIRKAYLNPVKKNNIKAFKQMKTIFEKSIVAKNKIKKGEKLNMKNLTFKKPGNGISAARFDEIVNKKSTKDLLKDEQIKYKFLE